VDEQDPVTRARRRLRQIGVGHVDFAGLLFTAYPDPPEGTDPDGEDPYSPVNVALDELVAVGYLDLHDRPGAEVTCWSVVHGFSVLNVEGPLRGMPEADRWAALTALLLGSTGAWGGGGSGRSSAAEDCR
jgi:hypothetical protein